MLNVIDIVGIIDGCILTANLEDCSCGDLNVDEQINVIDIVIMVNYILGN